MLTDTGAARYAEQVRTLRELAQAAQNECKHYSASTFDSAADTIESLLSALELACAVRDTQAHAIEQAALALRQAF